MARGNRMHRHGADEDTQVLDGRAQEGLFADRDMYGAQTWPGGIQPHAGTGWSQDRTRVSAMAAVGLIASVVGLCAAVTGLLAPEGAAVAVIGFLAAIGGLVASTRPAVIGRGLAALGALIALAAVLLAVLAMTGRYPWLNSRTDEISRWHTWLVHHWAWLGRW